MSDEYQTVLGRQLDSAESEDLDSLANRVFAIQNHYCQLPQRGRTPEVKRQLIIDALQEIAMAFDESAMRVERRSSQARAVGMPDLMRMLINGLDDISRNVRSDLFSMPSEAAKKGNRRRRDNIQLSIQAWAAAILERAVEDGLAHQGKAAKEIADALVEAGYSGGKKGHNKSPGSEHEITPDAVIAWRKECRRKKNPHPHMERFNSVLRRIRAIDSPRAIFSDWRGQLDAELAMLCTYVRAHFGARTRLSSDAEQHSNNTLPHIGIELDI